MMVKIRNCCHQPVIGLGEGDSEDSDEWLLKNGQCLVGMLNALQASGRVRKCTLS